MNQTSHHLFDRDFASPDELIAFARAGHLPKGVLAEVLTDDPRHRFLAACAVIEKEFTKVCSGEHDPCLEAGCSFDDQTEICLQPLERAGDEYHKRCAAEWMRFFEDPDNRVEAWKH